MKTPREILLARHQAAKPKLDEIRRDVVADMTCPTPEPEISFGLKLWRELILPWPRAWATVAAVWVVIVGLKVSTPESPRVVAQRTSTTPEVLAEVRQQKLLFAELVGVARTRVAAPTKSKALPPRSDRRVQISIG